MRFKVGDYVRGRAKAGGPEIRGTITAVYASNESYDLCSDDGVTCWFPDENLKAAIQGDNVNHPPHYTWGPVEVIEITERLNFCLGNVVKYVLRADHKGKPIEDLKKAAWYLQREIKRRESE